MKKIFGILFIVLSVFFNIYLTADKIKTRNKDFYTVTEVTDGDTFVTNTGAKVRILGIDAPEMGLCGSQEAKDELEKLILNKKVKISSTANDTFKRLVSDVYLDGASVNNLMIASGWAAYDSSDSLDAKAMRESGENARKNKIGIYSQKCSQTIPPDGKCRVKANINDATGDKIYYLPSCGVRYDNISVDLFRGDQWFCSEKQAQTAGFAKAKACP
ncbi:thermonuclease family protein [Candidatus Collierbacteria bacterium]|nr:thermonuclease family protein [Candidatus Collierbacteria bacterium]